MRRPTRLPLTAIAAAIAIPAAAMAQQTIGDGALRRHNAACIERCTQARSHTACAEICGCMMGELRRHWTKAQFDDRSRRLSADPADPTVRGEMNRIAGHCARRNSTR